MTANLRCDGPRSTLRPRQLLAALAAGALGAAAAYGTLAALLPAALASSLLPAAGGLAVGSVAAVAVGARWSPALRRLFGPLLVAVGGGALVLAATLLWEPAALDRRHFHRWMPPVAGAGLLIWLTIYLGDRDEPSRPHRRRWLTALLAGLTVAATLLANGKYVYESLAGEHLRTWNVYHYYLGAKYFPELGYTDLYAATLAADDSWRHEQSPASSAGRTAEDGTGFGHIRSVRDMSSYRIVGREAALARFDRSRFSDERWVAFGRDTRRLRPSLDAATWELVLRDWGYNPAPPRTAVDRAITAVVDLDGPAFRLLANSDLPLFAAMFAALWWAFGLRVALAATLWAQCIHFNRGRFAGGFLQYDWLASAVIAVALFARDRRRGAGLVLSWAVMTRVFPGVLALPVLATVGSRLLRRPTDRPGDDRRGSRLAERLGPAELDFLGGLVAGCALWAAVSLLSGRGATAWLEWLDNISLHHRALPGDPAHLGLARLAFHRPSGASFWSTCSSGVEPCLAAVQPGLYLVRAVGTVLLVAAARGRRTVDAMVLMLFAAFLWLTMTRYYGTIWLLLFALGAPWKHGRMGTPAAWGGAALLAMAASYYLPPGTEARYLLVNYLAVGTFSAVCLLYLVRDLRRRRSRRRRPPAPAGR